MTLFPKAFVAETSMRRSIYAVLIFIVIGVCFSAPIAAHAHHLKQADTVSLPVTTSSAQARALYQKGMQDYENLYLDAAMKTGVPPSRPIPTWPWLGPGSPSIAAIPWK